jgi:hypothetical protein
MDLVILNQPRVFPYQIRYQIVKRVVDVALPRVWQDLKALRVI